MEAKVLIICGLVPVRSVITSVMRRSHPKHVSLSTHTGVDDTSVDVNREEEGFGELAIVDKRPTQLITGVENAEVLA